MRALTVLTTIESLRYCNDSIPNLVLTSAHHTYIGITHRNTDSKIDLMVIWLIHGPDLSVCGSRAQVTVRSLHGSFPRYVYDRRLVVKESLSL